MYAKAEVLRGCGAVGAHKSRDCLLIKIIGLCTAAAAPILATGWPYRICASIICIIVFVPVQIPLGTQSDHVVETPFVRQLESYHAVWIAALVVLPCGNPIKMVGQRCSGIGN